MSTARAAGAGQSDEVLVGRAQRGDSQALDVLVRRHQGFVMAMAMNVVRDEETAADVAQECWLKVVRRLDLFDGRALFKTWLGRIACYAAIDWQRRKVPVPCSELAEESDEGLGIGPDDLVACQQLYEQVAQGIEQLSVCQRQVMELVVEERTQREIAETLALPQGTAMSRRFLARKRLRELLAAAGQ